MENVKSGPEKGLDRKLSQWEKSGLSAKIGGLCHDAVALAIARLAKDRKTKADLDTHKDYEEEIKYWLDFLFKLAKDKQDFEEIPVIEEKPEEPKPLTDEQIKESDLEWQKRYNQTSELDDINKNLDEASSL